ncbi:MAG: methyltransferase domain-containing protein [Spartobacteria bacterium]|nr:methyltransferase domain-containing protein [Spartobacteria bacterium]
MISTAATVSFEEQRQELILAGTWLPRDAAATSADQELMRGAASAVKGKLFINCKRLLRINAPAFRAFLDVLKWISCNQPELEVQIIISSVIPWASRRFRIIPRLSERFSVLLYDQDFYPGQDAVEDASFIPVLQTQSKIIWEQEKDILPRHGLTPNMKVADICCGIGTFASQIARHFEPKEVIGVDHAQVSLDYARYLVKEFCLSGLEFIYGDASNLLLEDDRFDFVACRLALQIFNQPEHILRELIRICAPGGRVYLLNETFSRCFGYPCADAIAWTYQEASGLFGELSMDLEFGPKMRCYMVEAGLEDIRVEPLMLTSCNTSGEDFAAVIRSWEHYVVEQLAAKSGKDKNYCQRLHEGFAAHIRAVTHEKGFGGWPIWAASGRKGKQ